MSPTKLSREKMFSEMPGVMFVSRWMIMSIPLCFRLAQQLRELGENGCDALRFIAREQLAAVATRLLFEIHVGEGLPVQVFDYKTAVQFLDGPGLWKVALRHGWIIARRTRR